MRGAALLLLVTLIGPSIATATCELTCVRDLPHSAEARSAQNCHEQGSSPDGFAVASETATVCHDPADTSTATAADSQFLMRSPAVVRLPAALWVDRRQLPVADPSPSFFPLEVVSKTTQLRI